MPERTLWLFRSATEQGKDVLVFDPGAETADLHVYTHEKSVPAEEVKKRAERRLGHSHDSPFLGKDLGKLEFGKTHGKQWTIQD
jgi:hypothetical protein